MKKIIVAIAFLTSSFNLFSQAFGVVNADGTSSQITFIKRDKENEKEKFKKIAHKMYENDTIYKATKVDAINETVFLRYNIYKDQMEFVNKNRMLFLKKEKGRKIVFQNSNEEYRVFNYDDELTYFQIHNSGENLLMSRKIINYIEAKEVDNSYQTGKPATFRRDRDKLYIKFKDEGIVELPSRKKNFYAVFDDSASEVKKFVKQNKINIKKIEDLKKLIAFINAR